MRLDILRHGLDEETAFHVEAATIDALRLDARDMGLLTNAAAGLDVEQGRQSVADINALYAAPPVGIAPEHKVVLIRINNVWFRGISPERLYEVTRTAWVVGANRRADQDISGTERGSSRLVVQMGKAPRTPTEPV